MRTTTALALTALSTTLLAAPVRADDDDHLVAAQQDLRTARDHLKAAGKGYGGHRQQALDRVENALQDVNAALRVGGKQERHEEKKVQQIDKQIDRLEQQKKKLGTE